MDDFYGDMAKPKDLVKKQISSLLANDWEFVKLAGFMNSPPMITYRDWRRGNISNRQRLDKNMVYIQPHKIGEIDERFAKPSNK